MLHKGNGVVRSCVDCFAVILFHLLFLVLWEENFWQCVWRSLGVVCMLRRKQSGKIQ